MMFAAQKPQIVAPSSTHECDYEHMSIPAWSSMLSLKRGDDDISTHDRPRSPIIVLGCSSSLGSRTQEKLTDKVWGPDGCPGRAVDVDR